jgi:hypothetical protein
MFSKLMSAVLLAGMLALPASASAATPVAYHSIHWSSASASFHQVQGDYAVDIYIGTSVGRWSLKAGSPPQIVTGGLTSIDISVYDLSRPTIKGYAQVASWSGQIPEPGRFHGSLAAASVHAVVPISEDFSGQSAVARIDVSWTAIGPSYIAPSHLHARYPKVVTLVSNSNDNERPALAVATASVAGATLLDRATDDGATLHSTKFNCRQIGYRQITDFDLCLPSNGHG